jgi:RNA-directed DNA polymerase
MRMLIAGIMEDVLTHASEEGAPQGSIVSPILSNVYLHYALDLWFEKGVKPHARGEAHLFRYADDFLCAFQYKDDAEAFERNLKDRLEGFGLEVAPEKTRRMEYGSYAVENAKRRGEKSPSFTFLGLTHFCGQTRHGHFKVKRYTSVKKFRAKLREYTEWIRKMRGLMPTRELVRRAKARIAGHLNYYAITDNYESCRKYHYWFTGITFKWLNRRSQRKSYNWQEFGRMLKAVKWPIVKIKVDLCPFRT